MEIAKGVLRKRRGHRAPAVIRCFAVGPPLPWMLMIEEDHLRRKDPSCPSFPFGFALSQHAARYTSINIFMIAMQPIKAVAYHRRHRARRHPSSNKDFLAALQHAKRSNAATLTGIGKPQIHHTGSSFLLVWSPGRLPALYRGKLCWPRLNQPNVLERTAALGSFVEIGVRHYRRPTLRNLDLSKSQLDSLDLDPEDKRLNPYKEDRSPHRTPPSEPSDRWHHGVLVGALRKTERMGISH